MKSLKILLACSQAPLPEGGAAGKWVYALLRGLAQRGHRVTVLASCRSQSEARAVAEAFDARADIRCFVAPSRSVLSGKFAALRRPQSYLCSPEMAEAWRAASAGGYDVHHLEETWTGWLDERARAAPCILTIYNLYAIDWTPGPNARWQERVLRARTVTAERGLIGRFENLVAVSGKLASEVSRLAPRARVHIVPLALDLERYGFVPLEKRPKRPTVALIGAMDWPPSRAAAERLVTRLWPAIRRQMPEARLQITGRGARRVLGAFEAVAGVEIHEDVPSIREYFEDASVLAYAPEKGSGAKVKTLEAFAYGTPVVATPPGVEGIDAEDGVHAGIHEEDDGLVERILTLLRDPGLQERQRRAARRLVEKNHSSSSAAERMEEVYASVRGDGGKQQRPGVPERYAHNG